MLYFSVNRLATRRAERDYDAVDPTGGPQLRFRIELDVADTAHPGRAQLSVVKVVEVQSADVSILLDVDLVDAVFHRWWP